MNSRANSSVSITSTSSNGSRRRSKSNHLNTDRLHSVVEEDEACHNMYNNDCSRHVFMSSSPGSADTVNQKQPGKVALNESSNNCNHQTRKINSWHGSRWYKYFLALRPMSFIASLAPVGLGALLAYKATGSCDIVVFILTCIAILGVHGAGNLANTYYDFVNGVDKQSKSDDRTLVDHRLTVEELAQLGAVCYTIGLLCFTCLTLLSPAKMAYLACLFFGGLSFSFFYTGGIGLKYIALGDVIILIMFGPISLLFSYTAQSGSFDIGAVAYALPLALNTEAIFHSNNTRDIVTDSKAGAVTLAIILGHTWSHVLYALLLFVPYIAFIAMALRASWYFFIPLITLRHAFNLEKQFRSGPLDKIPRQTAKLNMYFAAFYLIAVALTETSNLPFLHFATRN